MEAQISVIIPAFNEEALLAATLASVADALRQCGVGEQSEVIVVDNNSTDRTASTHQRRLPALPPAEPLH